MFEDSYAVDIAENADVPLMISLAIVMSMIREHQEKKEKI